MLDDDRSPVGTGTRFLTVAVAPFVAAWTPNLIFLVVGLFLLHLRATNREMPSFNPVTLWRSMAAS